MRGNSRRLLLEFLLFFNLCLSFIVRKKPDTCSTVRLRIVKLHALSNTTFESRPGFAMCDSDGVSPLPFRKRRVAVILAH